MSHPERSRVLTALCLLSFIGSGGGFLLYFLAALFFEKSVDVILKYSSLHSADPLSPVYFLLFALFFLISLTGVTLMWKMKKYGFYVYAAAQIIILAWPLLWLGKEAFSAVAMIFTVLFVVLYASRLPEFTNHRTQLF